MPVKSLPIAPDARQRLLDAIGGAEGPILVADLGKLPGLGRKLTAKLVQTLLAEESAVFLWGSGKAKAYWRQSPSAVARDRLLRLAGSEALTAKPLEQRAAAELPSIAPKIVKAERAQLEKEKRLLKKSGLLVDAQHPHPYLEKEIADLLTSFGIERSASQIRGLLDGNESAPKPAASGVEGVEGVDEVAEKIFAALNRIAFAPGTTVTFYRLRQQPELAGIPKDIFDRAALALQQNRRALLSVHDHAASLPAEDQQRLVTDGLGTYYVSIYAR